MRPPIHSKRAQLLTQVLDYIDRGDYDESNEFLVFGKEAFDQYLGWSDEQPDSTSDSFGEFATKRKKNDGERIISKRTSLSAAPVDTTKADIQDLLSSLPEETKALLAEHADAILSEIRNHRPTESESEALDAALARKAVQVLDQSFMRLSMWDEVEIPRRTVQNEIYFDEAHKCDIFGLKIATAVLCRAVLESALIQVVDPRLETKKRVTPDGKGHISLMLDDAKERGLLDESLRLDGEEVREAGNAIHPNKLREFYKTYAGRTQEIIDITRRIILHLYSV